MSSQPHTTHMQHYYAQIPYLWAFQDIKTLTKRKLYRLIPLIGIMYKSFGKHKKECMVAFEQSEREIINWLS